MLYILLIGAALNFSGAAKLAFEFFRLGEQAAAEHRQLKLFVMGVATVFGALYLYLFAHPQFIDPFLWFGAALKAWAFITCLYLKLTGRIDRKLFLEFGLTNGVVAVMFVMLLINLT
ncbi:MAG: hypothetical protein AseanaTS_03590 [Candidatus Pelagadaptatus aseana]|uniref:hypothetical protein n=1 Tax=Candidatus Pelagadaptatus aseana TaxID=3120508 RepID=UPI0039B1C6CB